MDKLWPFFKSLFAKAKESSPSQPFLHELIERSEAELQDYEHWKNTLVRRRLTGLVLDQYAISRVLPRELDETVDFLDTPSSKGFAIHFFKTRYSRRDATFLLDYLKEKVRELGYRAQISDTRTYTRPNWVETVERHYLKPRFQLPGEMGAPPSGKARQRFGNITIELELHDGQAHNLRFRATSYRDHLYEEPEDFEALMKQLLV